MSGFGFRVSGLGIRFSSFGFRFSCLVVLNQGVPQDRAHPVDQIEPAKLFVSGLVTCCPGSNPSTLERQRALPPTLSMVKVRVGVRGRSTATPYTLYLNSYLYHLVKVVPPPSLSRPFPARVAGFGLRVLGLGFRVPGVRFRVCGFGFRFSGFGFRVSGF